MEELGNPNAEPPTNEPECVDESALESDPPILNRGHAGKEDGHGCFPKIRQCVKQFEVFSEGCESFRGEQACLDRADILFDPLKQFIAYVRKAEKLISKAQIEGQRPNENDYNVAVSQLHRARQFQKYTAAKSSRMYGWMAAQSDFVELAKRHHGEQPPELDDPILQCSVLRPICNRLQVVIYKEMVGGIIRYELGLVFAVFRGSLCKIQAVPRKLKVSKCMALNSPVEAVARITVLHLSTLKGGTGKNADFFVSCMSPVKILVPSESLCCEVPISEQGVKRGKLFISLSDESYQIVKAIQDGELNPLQMFLKQNPGPTPGTSSCPNLPTGFSILDFGRGAAGQKNIRKFFLQLPGEYAKAGINLLTADGTFRIRKNEYHSWDSLATRCAAYFESFDEPDKGKKFSGAVYHKLAQPLVWFDVCFCIILYYSISFPFLFYHILLSIIFDILLWIEMILEL